MSVNPQKAKELAEITTLVKLAIEFNEKARPFIEAASPYDLTSKVPAEVLEVFAENKEKKELSELFANMEKLEQEGKLQPEDVIKVYKRVLFYQDKMAEVLTHLIGDDRAFGIMPREWRDETKSNLFAKYGAHTLSWLSARKKINRKAIMN